MKKIAGVLIVLLAVCATAVCADVAMAGEKRRPIKIAASTWPGWSHVFLAQEKGFFKKNNVDIELIHIREHIDAQKPFLNGEVDGVFQCLTDTIIQNMEISSKVVYVSDYSFSGDVIVGKVDTLSSLKGKVVGIEGVNTFSHIFVLKSLENAGLKEYDVRFEIVAAHKVLEALEKGHIDAGHTWEPTKSDAIEKGCNVLAAAGDIPGIITDLLVFNSEIIKERPEDIQAIVTSLVEAQEYRDTNWVESIKIMAEAVNISYTDMESGVLGTRQLDLQGNIEAMRKSDDFKSLYGSGKFKANFYLERGQLSQLPDIDEIIEPGFVKALSKEIGK